MNKTISRREFIKYAGMAGGGLAVIVVGNKLSWFTQGQAYAASQTLNFTITDAIKEMCTHNSLNSAECYYWIYKCTAAPGFPTGFPAEVPGPIIMATHGDSIVINVTNSLDEPHTLSCPTLGITGESIAPNTTRQITIQASVCGSHMYYDHMNAPVNRMMGLHGAIIVMPVESDRTPGGHNLTPYGGLTANHGVQKLYDDFGNYAPGTALTTKQSRSTPTHFPGLAWEEGDSSQWALYDPALDGPTPIVNCPPFRNYVWIAHQSSPVLFAEVGNYPAGQDYPASEFMNKFLRTGAHNPLDASQRSQYFPQYFTMNGQSGFFSHFNPYVTMMGRVGEPVIVHILNAGLWAHSMHLHANHFYVTSVNGEVNTNPIWVDVYRVDPMDRIDYTVPFMRPPDVGHPKGIGLPETPLQTANGHPVWPPIEEFQMYMPPLGTKAKNPAGQDVELGQRMSPLCYPMHDHSEPSQTSQGGNYNTGLISGIYYTGDRQGLMDFPMDEDFHMGFHNHRGCYTTDPAAPPLGEH